MCTDGTVLLPNFKAVGQTQAELHSLKVKKLDACIRPFCKFSHIYQLHEPRRRYDITRVQDWPRKKAICL